MSYAAIAREKAAIVERTGLLGEGRAGQQMVARFFIEGFGTAEQRAAWLPHLASVAISEPRVGAHPKLLTTRAEETGRRVQHLWRKGVGDERSARSGVHRASR